MDSFTKAMHDAQAELQRLEERRAKLRQLIEDLKALSNDEFAELAPPPGYEPEGLTAEIRKVLNLSTVHLSPVQIRDSLLQRGFSDANPKNLLISVHTVLDRIEKELDVTEREGKQVYKGRTGFLLGNFVKALAETRGEGSFGVISPAMQEAMEKAGATAATQSAAMSKVFEELGFTGKTKKK